MMATQKEISVIKQSFKEADTSSTGRMSKQLCAGLFKDISSWSEEDIAIFLDLIPVDADGMVSSDAFVDWVFKDGQEAMPAALPEKQVTAAESDAGFSMMSSRNASKVNPKDKKELTAEEAAEFENEKHVIMQRVTKSRRKSVQAASVSEDDIMNYKCPKFEKSADAQAKIRDALQSNEKMATLGIGRFNDAQMDEMVMAFEQKTIVMDQDVITQGEEGDCLYIIDEGNVDIFVARPGDDGKLGVASKVANWGPGALFGELALMYDAPRAATVKCASESARVWSIDRKPFSMLLKRCGVETTEQYNGFLTDVDIVKTLNLFEKGQIADAAESILLDEGEVIFTQGDEGDAFYILEDGACAAFVQTANGEEEYIATYEVQGDYFGELALLNNEPRKATVKATTDAVVLKIEKETFETLLAPIMERLKAKAKEYAPLPA